MGDHAQFIFDYLPPKEIEERQQAEYFIGIFYNLWEQSKKTLSDTEVDTLNQQAYQYTKEIREFKLSLIRTHLGELPTLINHFVNETEEYLRILNSLVKNGNPPTFHPIHHHLLWLPDAAIHAYTITTSLDMVEIDIKKKSEKFTVRFQELFHKVIEFSGYMRANLKEFPNLELFNQRVTVEIQEFNEFLKELQHLRLRKQISSTLRPKTIMKSIQVIKLHRFIRVIIKKKLLYKDF